MSKISIRFFNDREVRAIWDETDSKWWFSVLDIVGVLNAQDDYTKNRNYWKYLKNKLKNEGSEVVSVTNQLKLLAPDGKRRLTDVLDYEGVVLLAKSFPNTRASRFVEWFTNSDETIDGQIRTKTISKGGFTFCLAEYLPHELQKIESMPEDTFDQIVAKYIEMNVAHPFMEGNGRSTRIWLDLILKKRLQRCVDWSKINKNDYLQAMQASVVNLYPIHSLLASALTDKINDRDTFMKGIDYSYYYEQEDPLS